MDSFLIVYLSIGLFLSVATVTWILFNLEDHKNEKEKRYTYVGLVLIFLLIIFIWPALLFTAKG
jgi:uncharacterized membrane protein